MLQSLEAIEFSTIVEDQNYIIHVTEYKRYREGDSSLHIGTGSEIIEKLKDIFGVDEEDDGEWFEDADAKNGDGWDEVSVYKVTK
tara:strand:- start:61 stop:315 length:255 start_codon:yes stop_codon:yes gene_type:complete